MPKYQAQCQKQIILWVLITEVMIVMTVMIAMRDFAFENEKLHIFLHQHTASLDIMLQSIKSVTKE